MRKITVEVHRKIPPVSFPYTLSTHLVDTIKGENVSPKEMAIKSIEYSLEANGSSASVEPNLFFLMKDPDGFPFLYGSPVKGKLKWHDLGWIK